MARILENGISDYDSTDAKVLDFRPKVHNRTNLTNVAVDILSKFGIETEGESPSWGEVPDFDIYNMDAVTALRLSLAENFIDQVPKLYEVHVNGRGKAEWVYIGGNSWTPPDDACLMFGIPTYSPKLQGDLVIVRGFDRPPIRIVASNRTILPLGGNGTEAPIIVQPINTEDPSNIAGVVDGGNLGAYSKSVLDKQASIIYYEPVLDQAYKDDIRAAYNPRCFESLIAWKYRMKYALIQRIDSNAQIEFSNSATVGLPLIVTELRQNNYGVYEYICKVDLTSVDDAIIRHTPYGEPYSTFQDVNSVLMYGYQVINWEANVNPGGHGAVRLICEVTPEGQNNAGGMLYQLGQGSDWTWDYDDNVSNTVPGKVWVRIRQSPEALNKVQVEGPFDWYANWGTGDMLISGPGSASWLPIGQGLGYVCGGLYCNVVLNVPSINIYSPMGEARLIANSMIRDNFMSLTPVVLFDPPAPIYYKFKEGLGSLAGFSSDAGFVDQEKDITDGDPTTLQNLQDTDSKKLQNATNGFTIDVSLPFIKDGKITNSSNGVARKDYTGNDVPCLSSEVNPPGESETTIKRVRDFLFELYADENINKQYSFSAGIIKNPPKLGNTYEGGIINSINYSFQDGSSFSANVTVGPKLINTGSWGTSIYRKQTEDVSREGTVIQVAGDNSLFAVKIWRLGVYSATSAIRDEIEVGDRVSVTVYNNPVEF
jgi:hypothetical protein